MQGPDPHRSSDHLPAQRPVDEAAVLAKVNGHILPLFCCLAMLCYLDRVNLAFAARQLNEDLGFSKAVYGLGSGACQQQR